MGMSQWGQVTLRYGEMATQMELFRQKKSPSESSRFSEPIFLEVVCKTLASVMYLFISYIAIGE